jgi:O-antigen ligase
MKRVGRVFEYLAGCGLVTALVLAPTQWSFTAARGINVSPGDLLLLPVAGCWLLGVLVTGRWRRLVPCRGFASGIVPHPFWRFWPHALLVLIAAVSVGVAADRAAAVKEVVQLTLYLIVAPLLVFDFVRPANTLITRRLALVLAALLTPLLVNVSVAVVQYVHSGLQDFAVRGLFLNRNVLGGYLALTAPILFGLAVDSRSRLLRSVAIFVLLATLTVTLAGAAYAAITLALLLLAARKGARLFLITAVCLTLWQVFVLPRLPRENDLAHFRSVALYDANGMPERRYPEWQAAASLILTHPLTGVGAGNYQRQIGQYYDVVPNATGPTEPDIQNLYLVLAASLGLPALFAWMAILGRAVFAAAGAARGCPTWQTGLAGGLMAGIGAFALAALWHPLLVRGIGIPLAAILALTQAMACSHGVLPALPAPNTTEPA